MILQIGRKRRNEKIAYSVERIADSKIFLYAKRYPLNAKRLLIERLFPYKKGFTLIELVIVAAIILVLVAIASPLFRATFRDLELKDAAYNLSKLIKYGQQRAIIEEKKYRLLFNFDKGVYHLLHEGEEEEELETALEDAPVSKKKWENVEGRFGEYFSLPDGVKFKAAEAGQDKITFLPNGRCDKITFYIIGRKNKAIEIKTNGRAGYVEVSEVKEE